MRNSFQNNCTKTLLSAALFLAFAAQLLFAQTTNNAPRIGITAGYANNRHSADFLEFDAIQLYDFRNDGGILPPNFQEGLGSGIFAGVGLTLFPNDAVSLQVRGVFSQHNARLTTRELAPMRILRDNTVDTTSYFLQEVNVSLPSIGAELLAEWHPFGVGFSLRAGVRAAYLLAPTYSRALEIVSPMGGTGGLTPQFDRRIILQENTPLRYVQPLQLHALGGIGYDFLLGEKLRITPEISYTFALTNAFSSALLPPSASAANTWFLHQIRAGISASVPLPETPKPAPPPPIDTAKPAPILAVQAFSLVEETNAVRETDAILLRVQQNISRSVLPLLPYIFFDGINSTTLPDRYATLTSEQTRAFRETKLSPVVELVPKEHSYYHVLNVVAERLLRYPAATLTIHGCTDNFTAEKSRADVAKVRGRLIQRYLREIWSIPESRLKLQESPTSPTTPSLPLSEAEKQAENRRVELRSDTPAVLENITLIDTARALIVPNVRFVPRLQNLFTCVSWKIAVRQQGSLVREFQGKGQPPERVEWTMDEEERNKLSMNAGISEEKALKPLEYELLCTDSAGIVHRSSVQELAFERVQEEREAAEHRTASFVAGKLLERFNLILFDFAKSTITQEQSPMLKLIQSRIKPRSTVRVDGFTDRTGLAEFNEQLSLQRASNVAQMLGFTAEQLKTNVRGYGASIELYNNDLPEGRFYSRTVRVLIETPQER